MSGWATQDPVQTPGVNDVYEYNEVHLSSAHRDSGDNNHPVWNLQPGLHNVLGVKLLAAQIPYGFHTLVDSGPLPATTFHIADTSPTPTVVPATVAPGNYSITELIAALNQQDPNLEFTWLAPQGRVKFHHKVPGTYTLRFDLNEMGPFLGWPNEPVATDSNGDTLAPYAPDPGPTVVLLTSRALSGRVSRYIRCNGSTTENPDVFAAIPIDVGYGEMIFYKDPNPAPCFDAGLDQLTTLDFALYRPHGKGYRTAGWSVDKNGDGLAWTLTLQILTQRDTSVTRYQLNEKTGQKRVRVQ